VLPAIAIAVSLAIAAGATEEQLLGGFAALTVGAGMYGLQSWLMADG